MDRTRLYEIIERSTKATPIVHDQFAQCHFSWVRATDSSLPPAHGIRWVDCYIHQIAVDLTIAQHFRNEYISVLAQWPISVGEREITPLQSLPSFGDITHVLDREHAFGFLALGEVFGVWRVNTPNTYGFPKSNDPTVNNQRIQGYLRPHRFTPPQRTQES